MSIVFDTNLIEYANSQGFDIVKADRKSYRVKDYGGLFLFSKGYHHFSETDSGNIVGFAKKYQGFTFIEAVEHILNSKAYTNTIPIMEHEVIWETFELHLKNEDTDKIKKYLVEERCFENKKGFCCSSKDCQFAIWKENKFFIVKKKTETKSLVSELLSKGKATL